jgi:hypothetical protein
MEITHLKTIVVGGSNSVMRPGYIGETLKLAKTAGIELDIIEDFATGATTLFNGLYRLLNSQRLAEADLLILEYALNDTPTYADNLQDRELITHWCRAYEGILRYARQVNPNIRIVSLILEARTGIDKRRLNLVNAGIHYLSTYYDLDVVDIAAAVVRESGLERAATFEFYKDSAHYKPGPFRQIASRLIHQLMTPARPIRPLPDPLDPNHFADAKALNAVNMGQTLTRFSNSRFAVETVELNQGELEITLKGGKLLALIYVNEPRTGTLHLNVDGQTFACYTQKMAVRNEDYPWLLGMFSCEFLHPKTLLKSETSKTYRLSTVPMSDEVVKPYRPSSNIVDIAIDKPRFAVAGLLFTGSLSKMEFRNLASGA